MNRRRDICARSAVDQGSQNRTGAQTTTLQRFTKQKRGAPGAIPPAAGQVRTLPRLRRGRDLRIRSSKNHRGVAISRDGGKTFYRQYFDKTLIEPRCQGALTRVRWAKDGKPGVIAFRQPRLPVADAHDGALQLRRWKDVASRPHDLSAHQRLQRPRRAARRPRGCDVRERLVGIIGNGHLARPLMGWRLTVPFIFCRARDHAESKIR